MIPAQPDPTEARLREALQAVRDPELGESIVDLGLVLRLEVSAQGVEVVLIPTSVTCPMADVLLDDATEAVERACPAGTVVDVWLDWDTPWTPERLSPALKSSFGW